MLDVANEIDQKEGAAPKTSHRALANRGSRASVNMLGAAVRHNFYFEGLQSQSFTAAQ